VCTQEREHSTGTLLQCQSRLGNTLRSVHAARPGVLVHAGRLRHSSKPQMSPLLHLLQGWPAATMDGSVLDEPALRESDWSLGQEGARGKSEGRDRGQPPAGPNGHRVVARRRHAGSRDSAAPGPPHVRGRVVTGAVSIGDGALRREGSAGDGRASARGRLGLARKSWTRPPKSRSSSPCFSWTRWRGY